MVQKLCAGAARVSSVRVCSYSRYVNERGTIVAFVYEAVETQQWRPSMPTQWREAVHVALLVCMLCSGCEDRGIGGDASVKLKHQTQVLLKSEMAMKDDAVRFTFPIDEGTSSLRHVELISKDCSCVEPSFNGAQLHVGKPLRLQPNTPCVVEFDIRNQKKEAVDISRKLLIRISGYQDGDRDLWFRGDSGL